MAGLSALQGLRDNGGIQRGQRILINGAAGGVGTFAVQIAQSFGAEVTGVCSARNVDLVRSLGADHVIDYTRAEFTRNAERYDLILDCVENRPLSACQRVMTRKGTFVGVGAQAGGRWVGPLPHGFMVLMSSAFVNQKVVFFIASIRSDDLVVLKELIEAKRVTPVIDRSYALSQTLDVIRYLKEEHARGKVVLTVQS